MANAKAMFKVKLKEFNEIAGELSEQGLKPPNSVELAKLLAMIYSACIIAEAIRNSMDTEV